MRCPCPHCVCVCVRARMPADVVWATVTQHCRGDRPSTRCRPPAGCRMGVGFNYRGHQGNRPCLLRPTGVQAFCVASRAPGTASISKWVHAKGWDHDVHDTSALQHSIRCSLHGSHSQMSTTSYNCNYRTTNTYTPPIDGPTHTAGSLREGCGPTANTTQHARSPTLAAYFAHLPLTLSTSHVFPLGHGRGHSPPDGAHPMPYPYDTCTPVPRKVAYSHCKSPRHCLHTDRHQIRSLPSQTWRRGRST